MGQPSTGKTTVLGMLSGVNVYQTDEFTPASFVSHKANATENELKDIDLLPRVKGKVLNVKDLTPMFKKKTTELDNCLGILIRVLDGDGYKKDSGVHGKRGYEGPEYKFGFITATTNLGEQVWKHMSAIGPRFMSY